MTQENYKQLQKPSLEVAPTTSDKPDLAKIPRKQFPT